MLMLVEANGIPKQQQEVEGRDSPDLLEMFGSLNTQGWNRNPFPPVKERMRDSADCKTQPNKNTTFYYCFFYKDDI